MDSDLERLGERIAEQAAHLDAAMYRFLTDLREFDERGGWRTQGASSCAHWLAWRVGWDPVTGRERVRVARKLGEFPVIGDALRRGEVSYSKVRALLRVATPENEVLLLDHARLMTASQLEKLSHKYALVLRHGQDPHPLGDAQRRYVRRRDTEDGMVKIEAVLHPEEAELVWTMINHAAAQLTREPAPPASDDSAESGAKAEAPKVVVTPPSATHTDAADAPIDDSAESGAKAQTPKVAVAPPSPPGSAHIAATDDWRDDSAESGAATQGPRDASTPPSAAPTDAADAPIDDSAESGARTQAPRVACTPPSPPCSAHIAATDDWRDDSAEAGAVAQGPRDASTQSSSTPSDAGDGRIGDSAESWAAAQGPRDAVTPPPSAPLDAADDRIDDSAEASKEREAAAAPGPSVLHQRADAAKRGFNRADALVSIAQGYLRGDRPQRSPIEVTVTIPQSGLRADMTDPTEVGEMGESFVSAEAARRLSCDAGVIEVVEGEHGTPLSVGRKRRTIAGALKRALHKRDRICTYPGCTHQIFLEGHHIKHWADGGETSLNNIALLCSLHHRYVHEYGYTIELGEDQRPQFRDAHGRPVAAVPSPTRVADLGWPSIRAVNESLAIDADTIACEWDGRPVDYGTIVGHLATADGLR